MTNAITTKKAELQNSKKGFTLVELVVVIAILAILAAIAIPVVNSIINTASKNGALSNAQSIELAVKEAQSYIASGSTEIYNGTTTVDVDTNKFADGNGVTSGKVQLANAKTAHANLNIAMVAAAKGITDGFIKVSYNGKDYEPYWDKTAQKCIFINGDGKDLDDKAVTIGTRYLKLAATASGKTTFQDVKVDNMGTAAAPAQQGGNNP